MFAPWSVWMDRRSNQERTVADGKHRGDPLLGRSGNSGCRYGWRLPAHSTREAYTAEFGCQSAAEAQNSADGRLGEIAPKALISIDYGRGRGDFWAQKRLFPLTTRGILRGCYAGTAAACASTVGLDLAQMAGDVVAGQDLAHRRLLLGAPREGIGAAGVEAAARGRVDRA